MCRGQGQVRCQQGFFTVAVTCPQCRGAGRTIAKPCQTCQRRRPRGAGTQDHGQDSRRASPPGSSFGCRTKAKPGAGGGPAGHLYVVVHVQEHEFFRRDGNQPVLRDAGQLHHPGARRRDHRADARRPETVEDPRGHADRHDAAAARQGHARRERPRPRRSVRHRAGADAEEADARNSGTCSSSSRRCCPKEKFEPRAPGEEQDERNLFDRVKDMFG